MTPAQIAYMRNALAVMDAGTGKGNGFHPGGPGSIATAGVCERNRWILCIGPESEGWGRCWCVVTPAGRAIVEAAKVDKAAKYREHLREHNAAVEAARQT